MLQDFQISNGIPDDANRSFIARRTTAKQKTVRFISAKKTKLNKANQLKQIQG